jgi:hypothetical protein
MASVFRRFQRNIAASAKEVEHSIRRAASRAKEQIENRFPNMQNNNNSMSPTMEDDDDDDEFFDPEYADAEGLEITIPSEKKKLNINMNEIHEKLANAFEPHQQIKVRSLCTANESTSSRPIFISYSALRAKTLVALTYMDVGIIPHLFLNNVQITFKSTVPECGRGALLRFKACPGYKNDLFAYEEMLREMMPEERVDRECVDLMGALGVCLTIFAQADNNQR